MKFQRAAQRRRFSAASDAQPKGTLARAARFFGMTAVVGGAVYAVYPYVVEHFDAWFPAEFDAADENTKAATANAAFDCELVNAQQQIRATFENPVVKPTQQKLRTLADEAAEAQRELESTQNAVVSFFDDAERDTNIKPGAPWNRVFDNLLAAAMSESRTPFHTPTGVSKRNAAIAGGALVGALFMLAIGAKYSFGARLRTVEVPQCTRQIITSSWHAFPHTHLYAPQLSAENRQSRHRRHVAVGSVRGLWAQDDHVEYRGFQSTQHARRRLGRRAARQRHGLGDRARCGREWRNGGAHGGRYHFAL